MTKEKRIEIEELIKADEGELAAELEKVENREDFIKAFAIRGVEMTEEDADDMLKELIPADCELTDDELEGVAGGMSLLKAIKLGWAIGTRAGMLARMLYDKYKYNNAYRNYNWNNVLTGKIGIDLGGIRL